MIDFVADESVDFNLISTLRDKNYNVISILEDFSGVSDTKVLGIATQHNAILLTEDKDFGELVIRLKLEHSGILLIRLEGMKSSDKANLFLKTINEHKKDMHQNFSVLTSRNLRIRQLNS